MTEISKLERNQTIWKTAGRQQVSEAEMAKLLEEALDEQLKQVHYSLVLTAFQLDMPFEKMLERIAAIDSEAMK